VTLALTWYVAIEILLNQWPIYIWREAISTEDGSNLRY
jgi:hypothetical protein